MPVEMPLAPGYPNIESLKQVRTAMVTDTMPNDTARENIAAAEEEVIPHFRDRTPDGRAKVQ